MRRRYNDEDIKNAVRTSTSYRQVLNKLGLKEAGGNYCLLQKNVKKLQLSTKHFKGKAWNKGLKITRKSIPLSKILVANSSYTNIDRLRVRLLDENYFEKRCYECRKKKWLGKPIPLELEHINGDRFDHRIENLTILCPNCHAFTKFYRGKNIASYRRKHNL